MADGHRCLGTVKAAGADDVAAGHSLPCLNCGAIVPDYRFPSAQQDVGELEVQVDDGAAAEVGQAPKELRGHVGVGGEPPSSKSLSLGSWTCRAPP